MYKLLNRAAQNVTKNTINGVITKLKLDIGLPHVTLEDIVAFLSDINLGVFLAASKYQPSQRTHRVMNTLRRLNECNAREVKIAFQTIDRVPNIPYTEENFNEELHLEYLEIFLAYSKRT